LTVAQGIVKRENKFYLLRQINPGSSSNRAEHKKKGDYLDRMLIESWSTEFTQFVNSVAEIISDKDKIELSGAQQLVKKGYRQYLIPILSQQLEEFQGRPSFIEKLKCRVQGLTTDSQLQKTLRRWFHIYQDMTDNTPRPRPISPTSSLFHKVQLVQDFITSTEETDLKNIR
jgi:hypothetical protein